MKKVLFICSLYYPHVGGIETMINELSAFYRRKNIEPIILTKKWPTTLADYEEYNRVGIYRINSARTETEFVDIVKWLKENNLKIKADVIHVVGIRRPLPLIGLLLSRWWGVPFICTIAGGDVPDKIDSEPKKIWDEGKEFTPDVLRQSDYVNCVSKSLVEDLKICMPDLSNVDTLYAGMDFSIIRESKINKIKDQYIFSLRRLDPSKGIDILIKAFNIIEDKFPKLYLIIAGDGPEKEKLKKLVNDYFLNDRVIFIDTIELKEGISLLKGAMLTVVPSLSEGGGLVNIEAQAAGCPVIASRVGGIPEYVEDGESGLLFESGNYNELADKISLLLLDDSLRTRLINGGFNHAKKFDWDVLAPQYIDLYEKAILNYEQDSVFKPWSNLTAELWKELTH